MRAERARERERERERRVQWQTVSSFLHACTTMLSAAPLPAWLAGYWFEMCLGGGGCCNRTLDTSSSLELCIRLVQTASHFLERETEREREREIKRKGGGRERVKERKEEISKRCELYIHWKQRVRVSEKKQKGVIAQREFDRRHRQDHLLFFSFFFARLVISGDLTLY